LYLWPAWPAKPSGSAKERRRNLPSMAMTSPSSSAQHGQQRDYHHLMKRMPRRIAAMRILNPFE